MVDTATRAPRAPSPTTPARVRALHRHLGDEGPHPRLRPRQRHCPGDVEYLPGGFFVAQRFKADFDGTPIESLEIIGYDPGTGTFPSTVYANMAATPLAYDGNSTATT